ncbi:MAG: HD-GYP domain-containing protein [Acidobacteriia bacterium]|nr:HD-GYP domain-containing protein [Terriglobia bacterium]
MDFDAIAPVQATARFTPTRSTPWLQRLQSEGLRRLGEVNRELWLLLSIFLLTALLNSLLDSHHMLLGLYTLPTLFSAYVYGRRHATLTALSSVLVVVLITYFNPVLFGRQSAPLPIAEKWFEISVWGGILLINAYAMGTLYEHKQKHFRELRSTYHGVLIILSQFISKDKYTQNHSYRVSVYATKIAAQMGLPTDTIEDIRAAALIHDLGKLDVSREILYKAARLTSDEYQEMQKHVDLGVQMLQPVGGPLARVIPIILAHHDKFDGTGYHQTEGENIPLEARILSVADVYDSLTSDRPYRKAMSPFEAKETIVKAGGSDFDPRVVDAFSTCFRLGLMDIPEMMV